MLFLANSAHGQFLGLIVGFLAWILTMATLGLDEWRLWYVPDASVVTSGVAWVGIWRACFYSHALPKMENCQPMGVADAFLPEEIVAAQVLMVLAAVSGLAGNVAGALAMRMAYFSVKDRGSIRPLFVLAAALYFLTAALSMVPLVWNMRSVTANGTIDFPPHFHLPAAPESQKVGSAIGLGLMASVMMLISSLVFVCYRFVWLSVGSEAQVEPRPAPPQASEASKGDGKGLDNPTFLADADSP